MNTQNMLNQFLGQSGSFDLYLVKAMIAAAKAGGHTDAEEQ